jgi:tripartite-type tricarboxylate transporter receptor subunit TctC
MIVPRRRFLRDFVRLAAIAAVPAALSRPAAAQVYPTRAVRWVIGFPPGGGSDIVARIVARWLSERLGQEVIIENKPGAGTNLSVEAVAKSPPDGYTLLWIGSANAINTTLYEKLPFDFQRDIAPVAGLVMYPLVLEINPALPVKTVAELVAFAKERPGGITMASYGVGTMSHMAGELFKAMTGIKTIHVPYRGGAPMVTDLAGGQVQAAFDVVTNSLPHIRSGALRALGVTTQSPLDVLPDVRPISDTVGGYEALAWTGVGVPAGTRGEIIDRLNREINAGLTNRTIRTRLAELAAVPLTFTPAELGAYMVSETEKWAKVVKSFGARLP